MACAIFTNLYKTKIDDATKRRYSYIMVSHTGWQAKRKKEIKMTVFEAIENLVISGGHDMDDFLINPFTGSIDTAENWASELAGTEIEGDFSTLQKVNKIVIVCESEEIKEKAIKIMEELLLDDCDFSGSDYMTIKGDFTYIANCDEIKSAKLLGMINAN